MTLIVINQNILNYAIVTKMFAYILPSQNFVKKFDNRFYNAKYQKAVENI